VRLKEIQEGTSVNSREQESVKGVGRGRAKAKGQGYLRAFNIGK
jgi:hypothetical protein